MRKLDATREQACMANLKERYDIEVIRYNYARIVDSKDKYYTELSNNRTNFNDNNNTSLSNLKIQEAVVRVRREDE